MDWQMFEAAFTDGTTDHLVARSSAEARERFTKLRKASPTRVTALRPAEFPEVFGVLDDEYEAAKLRLRAAGELTIEVLAELKEGVSAEKDRVRAAAVAKFERQALEAELTGEGPSNE